jgi:spore coat polysaccharide biosynthesis protein SpsF (cytidylyltransferase family)/aryl-alcohol dehydrogenase-like predicted oxidoreductase
VNYVVLIQCRLSSKRLPAKALLPVRGIPSVVLCAQRAANTGLNVSVATSTDSSDDALCEALTAGCVPYVRGDLANVFKRFVDALASYPGDTVVVRLTADNLFVDGALVEETINEFIRLKKRYLTLHPPVLTGTPYGLSAEVFYASDLRTCGDDTLSDYDKEHVTSPLIRKYGRYEYRPADLKDNLSHLRCTLDSWRDYQALLRVFHDTPDPIAVPWQELCHRLYCLGPLYGIPQRFTESGTVAEMSLGSARLGIHTGAAGSELLPGVRAARALVDECVSHGVTHLAYDVADGSAELGLRNIFNDYDHSPVTFVAALSRLDDLSESATESDVRRHIEASVYKACCDLNVRRLPYLLLGHWLHRTSHGGRVWSAIKDLQRFGIIDRLGVSADDPNDALQALADSEVRFIRIPYNLLDRRWERLGFAAAAESRLDVIIQARNVFLEGLLLSSPDAWPRLTGVNPAEIMNRLAWCSERFGRDGVADLCVAYVRTRKYIHSLSMDLDSLSQLTRNVALFQKTRLKESEVIEVERAFHDISDELFNPTLLATEAARA